MGAGGEGGFALVQSRQVRAARFDLAQASGALRFHNAPMNWSTHTVRLFAGIAAALLSCALLAAPQSPDELADTYRSMVDRRLQLPAGELAAYAARVDAAFDGAQVHLDRAQYVVVVDRNPHVQALLLLWRSGEGSYRLVGASPVSTGVPGRFDYFQTPVGVFEHGPWNPDFRAEGTLNENGIRGYGAKGMRVFDFGWQRVPKGWGDHAVIDMRLQMHATDADLLEPRLGTARSKGCVRIPATLNRLLDLHGVLDAAYEELAAEGRELWVLDALRQPVPDAGRYLVIVDSGRTKRPAWSPLPAAVRRK